MTLHEKSIVTYGMQVFSRQFARNYIGFSGLDITCPVGRTEPHLPTPSQSHFYARTPSSPLNSTVDCSGVELAREPAKGKLLLLLTGPRKC